MREGGPKFESAKTEKPRVDEAETKKHLEYVEKIETSALEFIKQDIKIKQNKFGPADMTNEFAEARRLEGIINEFNKKAREQAKRGEVGKELSFNLSLPRQEEVEPEKKEKKIVEVEAQLEVLRTWSNSNELDRAMKQFIEGQIPLFEGLVKFLKCEAEEKKEKSKSDFLI